MRTLAVTVGAALLLAGCSYQPAGEASSNGEGPHGVTTFRDEWGRVCTVVQPFKTSGEVAVDCDWPK